MLWVGHILMIIDTVLGLSVLRWTFVLQGFVHKTTPLY